MKKRTKKLLYRSVPAIVLIVLFSIKFNTNIYVGVEDSGKQYLEKIAVSVKLDGKSLYETDSLPPSFMGMNFVLIEKKLRMGFHSIEVSTPTTGAELKKKIFILFNHYIMIAYWEGRDNFTVRTGFNPYLFM